MVEIANKTVSAAASVGDTRIDLPSAVGKYRPLRVLGSGASGVVYLAQDTLLERVVALKVLETHGTRRSDDRQRFLQEARAVAKLCHPRIVGIYEVDEQDGRPYIAMHWMEGGSVQQSLDQCGSIDWRQAIAWMLDACEATAAVHAAGMLHRDIKPGNLLLDDDGRIKLGDFGLVKLSAGANVVTSLSHGPKGTPSFMSPEQCRAEPLDEASDIYSLGATFYALLTGQPPYAADSPLGVMFAHCSSPPPDLRKTHPELPIGCAQVVQRAIAKDPDARYANVDELTEALTALASGKSLPADVLFARSMPARRRRAGLLAAALLVAAAAVAWTARPWRAVDMDAARGSSTVPTARSVPNSHDASVASAAPSTADQPPVEPAPPPPSKDPMAPVLPELTVLGDHRGQVSDMDFLSDGKRIVSIGAVGAIGVWDLENPGTFVRRLVEAEPPPHKLYAQAYLPRKQWLITGGDGKELTLWDLGRGEVLSRAPHPHKVVRSIDASVDGRFFVTGGDVGWNHWSITGQGKLVDRGTIGNNLLLVHTVRYSQVQQVMAATSGNGIVSIYNLQSPDRSLTLSKDDQVLAFAFGRARCEFAFVSRRGRMQTGTSSPRVVQKHKLASAAIMPVTLEFAPNRRLLAVGEERGYVSFFDLESGACHRFTTGRHEAVTTVRFSPDGKTLALGDSAGAIQVAPLPAEILPPVVPPKELALDLAASTMAQLQRIVGEGATQSSAKAPP